MDRDGVVTTVRAIDADRRLRSERDYWDFDDDGFVSDDERDEDADGLTNSTRRTGR